MSCPCEGLTSGIVTDALTGVKYDCSKYKCPEDSEGCSQAVGTNCVTVQKDIEDLGIHAGDKLTDVLDKIVANKPAVNVQTEDTGSVDFSGSGLPTDKLKAEVKISAEAGNTATLKDDGIFVPTPGLTELVDGKSISVTTDSDGKKVISAFAAASPNNPIVVGNNGLDFDMQSFVDAYANFTVGSEDPQLPNQGQYDFVTNDYSIEVNPGGDPTKVLLSNATVTELNQSKTWSIPTATLTLSDETKFYYLYAKLQKSGTQGVWVSSTGPIAIEDSTFYYQPVGLVSAEINGLRAISNTDARTTITGDQITTGKLKSIDGQCYFDLSEAKFRVGSSTASLDWNVSVPNALTIKGAVFLKPDGSVEQKSVLRGPYNDTVLYYKGDMVTYAGQLWLFIYDSPAKNKTPEEGTYWTLSIAKGSDGSDGSNGQDGISPNYTEFRYAVSASASVAPTLVNTQANPSGWTLSQPTIATAEYLWMISAQKKSSDNTLVGTWSVPGRITGIPGPSGLKGETGTPGKDGEDGQSMLKSFVYKRSTDQPTTPTGGSLLSPVPSGWSDGVPSGTLQLWISTRIFTSDEAAPQQAVWTTPQPASDSSTVDYEWSTVVSDPGNPTDNPSNWSNDATGEDVWMAVRIINNGVPGVWQINKIKGEKGIGIFPETVYLRSNTQPSTPTGGSYSSPIPAGWSDGVPAGEAILWSSSRTFTSDGSAPQDATWSIPSQMTNTVDLEYQWSILTTSPGDPTSNPENWMVTATVNSVYEAMRKKTNGVWGSWNVKKIKGEDGQSHYVWMKFADDEIGTGMSSLPAGKDYIGFAYNKTTSTPSSNPSDYTWSKYTGDQGIQGPSGANGQPTYTWIKFADDVDGNNMSDDPTGKVTMGIAYNKATQSESSIASDYVWAYIKGDKGDKGDTGSKGDVGPFLAPRGVYDPAKVYYGGTERLEVVYYPSTDSSLNGWYTTTKTAGSFSGITPSLSDVHWNKFTSEFEFVATDLFFATTAYIDNLGVRTVRTNDSGRRIELDGSDNGLRYYSSNGNLIMELIEEAGIGALNFFDLDGNVIVKLSQLGLTQVIKTAPTYTPYTIYKVNSTNYYSSSQAVIENASLTAFKAVSSSVYNSSADMYTIKYDTLSTSVFYWLQANDSSDTDIKAADLSFVKSNTAPTALTSADVGMYLIYTPLPWYGGGSPSIRNSFYYLVVVNDGSDIYAMSVGSGGGTRSRSVPVNINDIPNEAWS